MKKITPLLILLITLIGCSKSQEVLILENEDQQIVKISETNIPTEETDSPPTEETNTPPIEETPNCSDDLSKPVIFRVINELDVPIENVSVAGLEFGNLKPNESSCYLSTQTTVNTHVNEFWLAATIEDKHCASLCYGFCGLPPYAIYTYTSGKVALRIVSIVNSGNNCFVVKKDVEEELIFTETQAN